MSFLSNTLQSRADWVEDNCRYVEKKHYELWNNVINSFVASFSAVFTRFNLVYFVIAFILCDILLTFVDAYLFYFRPKRISEYGIEELEKYVKKLEVKYNKYAKEYDEKRKKTCEKCKYFSNYERLCQGSVNECSLHTNYMKYKRLYSEEKSRLDKMVEEKKKEIAVSDNRKSILYTDKLEYFKTLKIKIDVFLNDKNMKFLKSLSTEIKNLLDILEKKPFGVSMISGTLYIYLDELINVLNSLKELDSENKEDYLKQIEKITKALQEEIFSVSKRISESEEHSIDISIRTLMKELVEEDDV